MAFKVGDLVQIVSSVALVRKTPNGKVLGVQPVGSVGTISAGPSGSAPSWNVNFITLIDGWTREDNLAMLAPLLSPSSSTSPSVSPSSSTSSSPSKSPSASVSPSAPPPPGDLAVSLTFPDATMLVFNQSLATDLGDYVGKFVHQKCFVQRRDPWTIFFRPDADDVRQEVVVEYGTEYDFSTVPPRAKGLASFTGHTNSASVLTVETPIGGLLSVGARLTLDGALWGTVAATLITNPDGTGTYSMSGIGTYPYPAGTGFAVLPVDIFIPYVATISKGGVVLATVNVPCHSWRARWRWVSSPRPLVRTAADLTSMKAILPLDIANAWNSVPPSTARIWRGPMTDGGLVGGAPTGDSDQIGFMTESQACWLLTGNANALQTMLTWAEADGSVVFHIRDANSGCAPLDVIANPGLAWSWDGDTSGQRGMRTIPLPSMYGTKPAEYLIPDAAHAPSLAFIPWMLTDDPFFLEEAQMETGYHLIQEAGAGSISFSQERAVAWGLRDLSRLAAFAPLSPPSWLRPRSYYLACMEANRIKLAGKMTSSGSAAAFHMIPDFATRFSTFENDYLQIVLGWVLYAGFETWRDVVAYYSMQRLVMAAAPALGFGWDWRWPLAYQWPFPMPLPVNWAEAWTAFLASGQVTIDLTTWPANELAYGISAYILGARAALAALSCGSVPSAQAAHDWLRGQAATHVGATITDYKWALSPT